MGIVYLARLQQGDTDRYCVLKAVRSETGPEAENIDRFRDEGRVVAKLQHPNICPVFDVGVEQGAHFFAMDLIPGQTVAELLRRGLERKQALSEPVALHVTIESLAALDYAHKLRDADTGAALHIVHRDVAPGNVMVSYAGDVKLIDFGLALSTEKQVKTQQNVLLGRVRYMSPEHARGDALDARADQFAVGVMLYELLMHEPFYKGMSNKKIWMSVSAGFRPPGFASLDPKLRKILDTALALDRDKRYPSCGEFKKALEDYGKKRGLAEGAQQLRTLVNMLFLDEAQELVGILAQFRAPPASQASASQAAAPQAPTPQPPTQPGPAVAQVMAPTLSPQLAPATVDPATLELSFIDPQTGKKRPPPPKDMKAVELKTTSYRMTRNDDVAAQTALDALSTDPTKLGSSGGKATPFGAAQAPPFGAAQAPPFGAAQAPPFGAAQAPPFGASSPPASPFGAAQAPPFGAAPPAQADPFGAAQSLPTTDPFGGVQPQAPPFAAPQAAAPSAPTQPPPPAAPAADPFAPPNTTPVAQPSVKVFDAADSMAGAAGRARVESPPPQAIALPSADPDATERIERAPKARAVALPAPDVGATEVVYRDGLASGQAGVEQQQRSRRTAVVLAAVLAVVVLGLLWWASQPTPSAPAAVPGEQTSPEVTPPGPVEKGPTPAEVLKSLQPNIKLIKRSCPGLPCAHDVERMRDNAVSAGDLESVERVKKVLDQCVAICAAE
jgi:serine/threonine protein kinase